MTSERAEANMTRAPSLARSAIAPVLGQRVPLRGPARLLHRSYAKTDGRPTDNIRRLTSKLGDTFDVDLSSLLEWHIWAFGTFEGHFAELFGYLVRPGDRCIDVGANVGVHTVRLAKLVGQRGEVIAIEPDAELVRRASNNILLNHLENVRLFQAAACDRAGGSVLLYRPGDQDPNRARSSMLPHSYLTGSAQQVRTVSIDGINSEPVVLIKIDVEGCESGVVSGAARTIDAYAPSIVFEYAPDLLPDESQSPFGRLQDSGYELFQIRQKRNIVTGRGGLELRRLRALPEKGCDILAVAGAMTGRLNCPIR
jgi:FkbM family methyltransferase